MKNTNTLSLLALASLFLRVSGSTSLHPVLTGPDKAYLGSRVAFRCKAQDSSSLVTYELMRDGEVLDHTGRGLRGDQPASFFMKVTASSEGTYQCRATVGGNSGVSESIKLSVVTPASSTRVTSKPFPPVTYEGSSIVLSCTVEKGSHLSYTWFFNKKEVTSPEALHLQLTGNTLVIEKVTLEHAGNYYCMAWSFVQDIRRFSASAEVQVTVKEYVTKPKISFSIYNEGAGYLGNVSCWSMTGSLPVNFSLLLDDEEVGSVTATESLSAWFSVPVVPGLDMGVAHCRVKTEVQDLTSEPVTLEVVPVGGEVKVEVEYLYKVDSEPTAARLSCKINRGTFPHISWLLNGSVLPSETDRDPHPQPVIPHDPRDKHRRTLFVDKLTPQESGFYHCRVRDSYNESGSWVESAGVLVGVKDGICNSKPGAKSPTETPSSKKNTMSSTEGLTNNLDNIAIIFCCFLLLALAVCVATAYNMLAQEQGHTHIFPTDSDVLRLSGPASSQRRQDNTSSIDFDVHNQTLEIPV